MSQEYPAQYSIIQYMPDLGRREAVNIGVVIFIPQLRELGVKMTIDYTRVVRMFGPQAVEQIIWLIESIEARLKNENFQTTEELQQFIGSRANSIQMTDLRAMKVWLPMKEQLQHLFDHLVSEAYING